MPLDYCPYCRRRTPHIKIAGIKMCKRCMKQEKAFDAGKFKL